MRESRLPGSVRGAVSNERPYRDSSFGRGDQATEWPDPAFGDVSVRGSRRNRGEVNVIPAERGDVGEEAFVDVVLLAHAAPARW